MNLPAQRKFPESETILARPWRKVHLPKKILLIRLHAFGDLQAAMPAAQHLKEFLPNVEMHLLVCEQYADLPRNMPVFAKIHTLNHARGGWKMGFDVLRICPQLLMERFDAVIDLQNNIFSRTVRQVLFPAAWTQFDRFSKIHVVHRYQNTVNALGIGQTVTGKKIALHDDTSGLEKLRELGWNGRDRLVILNPCGLYSTRQWGVDKYLQFARIWLEKIGHSVKFLVIGLPSLQDRADQLAGTLGNNCINLVGKTTILEAFNIVRRADLTLSDDGGLLHASWINHVPTIGFLGASPSYWGVPLGEKSFGFTSADLPCGDCHLADCMWGDNRCLARVSPEMAFEKARELLDL